LKHYRTERALFLVISIFEEHPSFVLRCKGAAKNKAPQKVVASCYNLVSVYYRTVRKKRLFIVLYL